MSDRLEESLRDGLHARAGGHDLAPGAVAAAASAGRRRLRRRRAVTGGGLALVFAAAGVAVGVGWDHDAKGRSVVTADQPDPQPAEGAEVGLPLIVRSYDDNFAGLYETLKGKLVVSDEGCVAVVDADGTRRGIVFGPEWTADDDGAVAVHDAAGKVFARDGKKVTLYGGPATAKYKSRYGDDPCWSEAMFLANSNQAGLPYRDVKRSEMRVQPTPPDPHLNAKSPASEVVSVVAEHVYRLGEDSGYTGLRVDAKTRSVAVLWKGRPPAEVREYVASRPYGVEITVDDGARYSDAELKEARTRVLGSDIGVLIQIMSSDLNDDGSGFEIGVRGDEPPTAEQMAQLRAVAGIDEISVRTGVEPNAGLTPGVRVVPSPS